MVSARRTFPTGFPVIFRYGGLAVLARLEVVAPLPHMPESAMPIVNANTVPAARTSNPSSLNEPAPAWARPQVAWPFLVSKPLAAPTSVRPSTPSFST